MGPETPELGDVEFRRFRALVKETTGITLSDMKKALLVSRLASRLRHRKVSGFHEYYKLVTDPQEGDELQAAIDLITTNETSFFREASHFEVLRSYLRSMRPVPMPFRVWSAAASSGEEAYSLAMVLSEALGGAEWSILGTDISSRVLERATKALYPIERSKSIPKDYLSKYCLKGQGRYEGMFLIDRPLRNRVSFRQINLCAPLPDLGPFDVVFLRNILIYFAQEEKRLVVDAISKKLKPGGLLMIGHSETLAGISGHYQQIQPTVYRAL
ncbi:MAG: methyltransferase domain-containing protein [Acidobacteria bacterium]|nr:methyltransferase domain-containing protein [Acidobacteriota bacterium]MBI3487129.1 methyltransferase domain-containing protein [Acidobacteriota bacterium]